MTNRFLFSLLAAATAAFAGTAKAQSVTTDPVGFNTVNVNAHSVRALSLPLDTPAAFSGPVSSRTSTTITTANAGWTTDAYGPFAAKPHVIRLLSGNNAGRQYRIASNTADTLTLTPGTGVDLTSIIANGDRYAIIPVATLASVFGATGSGLNTSSDPAIADNVLLRVGTAWITYYNDGTQWLRQGTGSASNTVALLPEQGFLFARKAGSTTMPFTVTGAVPTTTLVTDLGANRTISFANRFPVKLDLVGTPGSPTALNLHLLNGWNANADPQLADNVLLRVGASWITYYYDGSNWLRQAAGDTPQNPMIGPGTSVLIVRRGGSDVTLTQTLPYTL